MFVLLTLVVVFEWAGCSGVRQSVSTAAVSAAAEVQQRQELPSWYKRPAKGPVALAPNAHNQHIVEHTIGLSDPRQTSIALFGYGIPETAGASYTLQPAVASWDLATNTITQGEEIASSDITRDGGAGHDLPQVIDVGFGSSLVAYGAISPFYAFAASSKQNPNWDCSLSSSVTWKCQPFKFGRTVSQLVASPEYLFPETGISELVSARANAVTLMGGQVQWGTHEPAGAYAFVTYHAIGPSDGYFDTARQTRYDPFTTPISEARSGETLLANRPHDNAWFEFEIISDGSAGNSVGVTIDSVNCTLRLSEAETAPQIAANFVRLFNDPSQCRLSSGAENFHAVTPTFDPFGKPGQTIGIESNGRLVNQLGKAPDPNCSNIECSRSRTLAAYGGHTHFVQSTATHAGNYFYVLLAAQDETQSWYGRGYNGYSGTFACLRSAGPTSEGVWTWTDCAGGHPFTAQPERTDVSEVRFGTIFNASSPYVIPPPREYPTGMSPFIYDMRQEAWPAYTRHPLPIAGGIGIVPLSDEAVWIVYSCQDSGGMGRLCYLRYDARRRLVPTIGFLDREHSSRSRAGVAVTLDDGGNPVVGAVVGNGADYGCENRAPCILEFRGSGSGERWTKKVIYSFTGQPTRGAPGAVVRTEDGEHLLFSILHGSFRLGTTELSGYDLKT